MPERRSQSRSGTRTTTPPKPKLQVYFQSTCCVQNPTLAHVVGCLILESQVNAFCYVGTQPSSMSSAFLMALLSVHQHQYWIQAFQSPPHLGLEGQKRHEIS
ncbi:hypothetical protein VPH35_124302 [Triticum aestivum]